MSAHSMVKQVHVGAEERDEYALVVFATGPSIVCFGHRV